jgi:hypothetical protein
MGHNPRSTTYDPSSIVITFGPDILRGFGEDTFVKVERAEDRYTTKTGVDGEGAFSRNNNRSGTIEVTLLSTSASNAVLSAHVVLDDDSPVPLPPLPMLVKDLLGNSLHSAASVRVSKLPASEYQKEVGERTWIFSTTNLRQFDGGN